MARTLIRGTLRLLVAVLLLSAATASAGERKVLTIAIDGLRPDALIAANAPNIDSLVDGTFFGTSGPSGIFVPYAQSEHLTFSGPGWGAYMTGLHVDRHGADTNTFENVVPGTTDWFTPLEEFDPSLDTHRVLTWQIAHDSFPSGADTATNYEYNANGDELMTDHVVGLMQSAATDVVMTFFSDVDGAGHTCGFDPGAPCYLAEISDTDSQIGEILSAMKSRPSFSNEDWLVILTTDHGGLGTQHAGGLPEQRTIPFVVAGPLATTVLPQAHPRQPDVAATVLTYFGAPVPSNYDGHAVGLSPAGPAAAEFGQNLVFNGDAEYNRGFNQNSTQQYAAGWENPGPGGITTISYDAGGGFPSPAPPGPTERGTNFYSGGTNFHSSMTQRIDAGDLAGDIEAGLVSFWLSGWLGGFANQNDTATVVARFLDDSASEIGSSQLAPVTASDRGNVTKLLLREQISSLPKSTRFIDIELSATRASGENDGYADNLGLVLLRTGDLDFNGLLDASDWGMFRSGQHANLAGLTLGEAYELGDLNGDLLNDHADFVIFKTVFDAQNGAGAFLEMLTSVPEPPTMALCLLAMSAVVGKSLREPRRREAPIVFKCDATYLATQRLGNQVMKGVGGRVDRQSFRADV
jgi:hypothetical protein